MPPKVKFNRESVIKAAFEVVRENGWQGLSARAIAKELKSSTGPIYSQLKSMETLEEEVVKSALKLWEEYILTPKTGDKWIDQGLGYVLFAKNEKNLFKALFDEKHIKFHQKLSPELWKKLGDELSDYPIFKDLSEELISIIRHKRWIFIHGVASLITNSYEFDYITTDEEFTLLIKEASMAIYRGYKHQTMN